MPKSQDVCLLASSLALTATDMCRPLAFIYLLLLLPFISVTEWGAKAAENAGALELGPMLGYVGSDEAYIWVKASSAASSGVLIGEAADLRDGRVITGPELTAETDHMGVVEVSDLRPATRHFYKPILDGKPNSDSSFSFVTAPAEGARGRVRFALLSCIGDLGDYLQRWETPIIQAWEALTGVPVDFVLRLGDNVYAGSTDPETQRRVYYWHRRLAAYREVMASTPMLAIWDDWDYAGNNSDGTAPGKERSLRTFKELWANPSHGQASGPGIYFKFSWGDVDLFMLDVRYHRSPNSSKEEGQKTMLGPAQLRWLKRELAASRATFKFLVSGSQWTRSGKIDSWRSFMRERNELFQFIRDNRIAGVVLLSGDRHITAGFQVQERFVEITSSPFASENHDPPYPPEEMFMLHDKGNFFIVLEVNTIVSPPRLVVEVHQVGTGIVRRRPLSWEEIHGRVRIPTCELFTDCRN